MSSPYVEIVTAQYAPNSQTVLYTSPSGTTTRIDKLTVTNVSGSVQTISINLVPNGGTVGASNLTTDAQAITPSQTWNSPNEYQHYLNPGDSLSVLASAASALSIAVAGLQVVG
jgi:hypothetical protein